MRCRRYVGGAKDDDGCVGGMPPREYTFAQVVELCADFGLEPCDRSCAGQGCR